MRAHIVRDRTIINTIEIESLEDFLNSDEDLTIIDASVGGNIGDLVNEDGTFTPPESVPQPVTLGVLSTDKWSIPADGTTFATVMYTSTEDVYFAVESQIISITPINSVATLQITADAPGPIRVDVQDKRLVIVALEVV